MKLLMKKIRCWVFGHLIERSEPERGVASGGRCLRCSYEYPSVIWPRACENKRAEWPDVGDALLALKMQARATELELQRYRKFRQGDSNG